MKLCFILSPPKGGRRISVNELGVSLVELLMVVVTVGFIILLLANLPNSMGLISKSRNLNLAREIVSKSLEDKRTVSFVNLVNGMQSITDSRIVKLPGGTGTVTVADCNPTICTNSEKVKVITARVTWNDGKSQNTTLTTMIGEGGLNQ